MTVERGEAMEQLALKVLNCLFGEYPRTMELERCREHTNMAEHDFLRVIAYLQEKAFLELENATEGICGVFGQARITAAGIDYVNTRSRKVRASVIRS